jgi:hypothetical protein
VLTIPLPAPAPRLRPVSDVTPRPLQWLWPFRLPLGKLAVLEGDPGLGKSFLALDLCARLSTGRPWPDDAPAPAPAASIFLNGEDGLEDTIGPRLAGLGADPTRVFVLDRQDDELAAALSLPAHVALLDALVKEAQARLLVIDPVMAFFGAEVNTAEERSMRRALAPLAALARRHACTVLLIRHLAKLARGRAITRGLGSIGLIGTCRCGWLVGEDTEVPGRRVLAQVKNNLAPPQPSLAFEVATAEGGAAALRWLGTVAATADDLLAGARRRGRRPEKRDAACAFLTRVLADGPLPAREVWRRAEPEGICFGTLRNAKDHLPIRTEWATVNGLTITYWLLPGQNLASAVLPAEQPDPVLERLRQLEQQYPSRSPLDDL